MGNDNKLDNAVDKVTKKYDSERKGQNEKEIALEMLPFMLYTALPLIVTFYIAWKFGPSY